MFYCTCMVDMHAIAYRTSRMQSMPHHIRKLQMWTYIPNFLHMSMLLFLDDSRCSLISHGHIMMSHNGRWVRCACLTPSICRITRCKQTAFTHGMYLNEILKHNIICYSLQSFLESNPKMFGINSRMYIREMSSETVLYIVAVSLLLSICDSLAASLCFRLVFSLSLCLVRFYHHIFVW